jgi:hypothetical protein
MKAQLIVLALFALMATASAIECPFTSGSATGEHCRLGIEPLERLYGEEMTVQIEYGVKAFEPVEDASVRVEFYDNDANKTLRMFKTDKNGQVIFTPEIVGYHLIRLRKGRTCDTPINVLIYVNTTCGDGVCGGEENRTNCAEDCGDCGDGICDYDENLSCVDCAVCGDGICSAGETRQRCLKDCVFCGDGVCDYLENRTSCEEDCASGESDGCCDGENDGKCDPDCEISEDPDCVIEEEVVETTVEAVVKSDEEMITLMWVILAILITVAIIGGIKEYLFEKKLKEKKSNKKAKKKAKKKASWDEPPIRKL